MKRNNDMSIFNKTVSVVEVQYCAGLQYEPQFQNTYTLIVNDMTVKKNDYCLVAANGAKGELKMVKVLTNPTKVYNYTGGYGLILEKLPIETYRAMHRQNVKLNDDHYRGLAQRKKEVTDLTARLQNLTDEAVSLRKQLAKLGCTFNG